MTQELKTMLAASVDHLVSGSPINEVEPESLQLLFDRINQKIIDGVPESITLDEIEPLVRHLNLKMAQFNAEQQASPKTRKRKPKEPLPDPNSFLGNSPESYLTDL